MSDEMQVQAQRPSATPYVLGGAAVGAGAGLVTNNLVRKTSVDDLIKEANSKDAFTSNTTEGAKNVTEWKDVYAQAEEVKKAEQALEEAKKPVLAADDTIRQNYEKAQKDLADEMEKLKSQEAERLSNVGSSSGKDKVRDFDALNTSGDAKARTKLEKEYNTLRTKYEKELQNVENKINTGAGKTKNTRLSEIDAYLNQEFKTYGAKSEDKIAEAFSKKTTTSGVGRWKKETPTPQYKRALDAAEKHFPEFTDTSIKPEQYLEFAQEIEPGTPASRGYTKKQLRLTDPSTGRKTKEVWVQYKDSELKAFVEQQNENVLAKREAYADELFENAHKSIMLRKEQAALDVEFPKSVEKGLANQSGLYNSSTDTLDFAKIQKEAASKKLTRGKAIGYDADIQALQAEIKAANKAGRATVMPTTLNGNYGKVTVEEALDMAGARKGIIKQYKDESKNIAKSIKKCESDNSIIRELDDKIADIRANHEGLNKARTNFLDKFPDAIESKGGTALSDAEIAEKAQAYAEKNINKRFQQAVDTTKGKYDDAIKNGAGKVDDAAVKQATSKLDDAKAALKSKADDLASKMKGGTKQQKLIAAGIGLAAGIGAALMIRPKNKTQA